MGTSTTKDIAAGWTARILLAAVLLFSAWTMVTRFSFTADLGLFLPPIKTATEKILIEQLGKGSTSKLLFVSLASDREAELREANKSLAARLRESGAFARILNGDQNLTQSDTEFIFKYRYLLAPQSIEDVFSVAGLRQALEDRLRGLASAMSQYEKQLVTHDPVGATQVIMGQVGAATATGPLRIDGVWMSRDRQRSLLIAEMKIDAFDFAGQDAAVEQLNEAFHSVAYDGLSLTVTGPGAFAVESKDTIWQDVKLLTLLATIFTVTFLFLAFRSIVFLILVLVPLVLGVLVAIASVLQVFGSIHGVTLAFGVTLTGVAVDYPIHLMSQMSTVGERAVDHVKRIWPTLRLGVMTTVIAYACLIFSDLRGLIQLGVFTVTGLLTAAAVTRWLLPHFVPRRLGTRHGLAASHNLLERLGRRAPEARIWVIVLLVIATAFLLLTDRPLRDNRLDSLSPIPQERRDQDRDVRRDLGMWSGAKLMAIAAPSAEEALQLSEAVMMQLDQLTAEGALSNYDAAARYLPSQQLQRQRQQALPDENTLKSRLTEALDGLPFKPQIFEPFIAEVAHSRALAPVSLDMLEDTGISALLAPLLFEMEGEWVAPILLHGVRDPVRLEGLAVDDEGVNAFYLDLKKASSQVMVTELNKVLRLLGWGVVFIYLVLVVSFRDVRKPLYILVPTIASVLVVTAILVAFGIQLTIFHMISLLLVIGLGLDYALFFNRLAKSEEEWNTTFKALWVCCVTTVLVFGALMLSHTPPLQAVGLTVSIGAGLCLVFGAVWSTSAPKKSRKGKRKVRKMLKKLAESG